jgi:acetyl esterase/lipase
VPFARLLALTAICVALVYAAEPAVAQDDAGVAATSTTVSAATDAVDVQQDIPYYEGGPVLDAYLPKNGQTKRPALVLVHGGGWNSGDKAEFAPYAVQAATNQQWVVFDVDYLLSPTDPSSWPDELHDIQAAIRYIAGNAQTFGVDPQRIVALGESAGANLIAMISSKGTANPVTGDPVGDNPTLAVPLRAVGLWSPPVDLADLYANAGQAPAGCGADKACGFVWSQGAIAQYMHCDPASCPEAYADASPITWVASNTAPSFVVNSTDELVPLGQVVQYVMKLQADNVDVQFVQLPGAMHGIEYASQMWDQTLAFLGQQLAPPPPTTTAPADTSAPTTATAAPAPSSGSSDSPTGSPAGRAWLLAGAVVLAGVVLALALRHRPGPPPSESGSVSG